MSLLIGNEAVICHCERGSFLAGRRERLKTGLDDLGKGQAFAPGSESRYLTVAYEDLVDQEKDPLDDGWTLDDAVDSWTRILT